MSSVIPYDPALILSLETSLSQAFGATVKLTKKAANHVGPLVVTLISGDKIIEREDDSSRRVINIRMPDRSESKFFVGFTALFEHYLKKTYHLRHASMTVFQDIYELVPFFRAEWDQEAAAQKSSPHAQPHWHFVQGPRLIENILRREQLQRQSAPVPFDPKGERTSFGEIADCGRFHFAMSERWALVPEDSHKHSFEGPEFRRWFARLTAYIARQIEYLEERAPTPRVRSFG